MSQDNNNEYFPGNNDRLREVDSFGNLQDNNINLEGSNDVQSNEGQVQQVNNFDPNVQYQQFENNGQFYQQANSYGQNNQPQFDNNLNAGNIPQPKKKFYKNPTNWVIFFTAILAVIYLVKILGANTDLDSDGLTREEEVETYDTNPRNADTDGDGFNDLVEIDLGTDPTIKAISMSSGTWTVGEEIEAGTYYMMCMEDEKGDVTVKTSAGEEKEVYELGDGLLKDGTTVEVVLEDGDTIEVESGLSVVYFEIVE